MRRLTIALAAMALVAGFNLRAQAALATSAESVSGTGCQVQDADGAKFFDDSCVFHYVIKRNADGSLAFLHYEDKGHLPEGAAVPKSAMQGTSVVPSGDFAGSYEFVVTPTGEYSSRGPN